MHVCTFPFAFRLSSELHSAKPASSLIIVSSLFSACSQKACSVLARLIDPDRPPSDGSEKRPPSRLWNTDSHRRPWPAGASWPGAAPGGPRPGRGPADVRLAEHGLYLLEALALDFLDRPSSCLTAVWAAGSSPGPDAPPALGQGFLGPAELDELPRLAGHGHGRGGGLPAGGLVGLTLGLLRAHMQVSALVEAACGLLAAMAMAVLRLPPAEVGGGWW
ncbi:hypothetical protein PAPYR_11950 [Paratrimastix pyriformis]|uniref:Uncharacterized protein n=1 Tax=Paratrimastix pyriformis TaxID=342808 RepID=A0ABQ8U877_9EUKA|nr:hypothetical protein PAPYR_11950 [Paratrimastix pyriformis]